jgi:hypothetical protein
LDVACGLLYLLRHWSDSTTLTILNPISNPPLERTYRENNIHHQDIHGVQIYWTFGKLYLPPEANAGFQRFQKLTNYRYLLVPLGIDTDVISHANYLVYDRTMDTLERFEPHGSQFRKKVEYKAEELDRQLEQTFQIYFPKMKYLSPTNYLPRMGLQILDTFERKQKFIGDAGGFCAIWAVFWVHLRLSYRQVKPEDLIQRLIERIRLEKKSFRGVIRDFSGRITTLRDQLLFQPNKLQINQWINILYTSEQFNRVMQNYQQSFRQIMPK